jgi:midasin
VGKSALVAAAAAMTGNRLVRIQLSDQTDINDLFGADLPAESESVGRFSWHDGPFLSALKDGCWILLDELNLATQSVLEGLNACLDHRGEVYIPELDRTFTLNSKRTKIFATQNPSRDGSGRKGLPKSFLNRFVKVFMAELQKRDIVQICKHRFDLDEASIEMATDVVGMLHDQVNVKKSFGLNGAPWSVNLRDLLRWCQGAASEEMGEEDDGNREYLKARLAKLLFSERFRTAEDRSSSMATVAERFGKLDFNLYRSFYLTADTLQIGCATLSRYGQSTASIEVKRHLLLDSQLPALESLMLCVKGGWIPILVGGTGAGKTALVEVLAQLLGKRLCSITLNSATDTTELLGTHEQTDVAMTFHKVAREGGICQIQTHLRNLSKLKNIISLF